MFLALTFFIHNLELDAWAVRLNAPAQNHRIPTRRERSRSQNQSVTSDNFRKDLENHKIVLVLVFVASLFTVIVFVAVFLVRPCSLHSYQLSQCNEDITVTV